MSALSDYANDLQILRLGGKVSDTQAAKRKAEQSVQVVQSYAGKVAIVPLRGVMRLQDGLCSVGVQAIADKVRSLSSDPTVTAIVVDADTGGGEALAGQEMGNAIAESKKPVLVYAHFLASAGVLATLQADEIYAAGSQTEVGSIGVKATVDKDFLAWYAETYEDFYADTSPNKNEEMRGVLQGDPSLMIKALNQSDSFFMRDVKNHRTLIGNEPTIEETLSGRMFFADEAIRRGLIDGIKTKAEVIDRAAYLADQYKKGKPNKRKNNMKFLENTALGDLLGITAENSKTDAEVTQMIETAVETLTSERDAAVAAKEAIESEKDGLATKVSELQSAADAKEAANTALSEKALSLEEEKSALQAKVSSLEKQVAALTLSSSKMNTEKQDADAKTLEANVRKAFGGEVELKK